MCIQVLFLLFFASCKGAELTISPNVVSTKATVSVSWTGIASPKSNDYVSMFMENYNGTLSTKYVNSTSTWGFGVGVLQWNVLNMRQRYFFRYYSSVSGLVTQSEYLEVDGNNPMQGHLAVTDFVDQMLVKWVSNSSQIPTVQYGLSNTSLSFESNGDSTTYYVSDMCTKTDTAARHFIPPGNIHSVTLNNLAPDVLYYYRYGSEDGWSPIRAFRSRSVSPSTGFRAILFGDLGVGDEQGMLGPISGAAPSTVSSIENDLATKQYDMVLHIGDVSYAIGYAWRWEQFLYQMEPIATQLPYMVGIGNHEYDYPGQPFKPTWMDYGGDSGGECGIPYLNRYTMPNNGLWYSIDYPLVHIVVMSSEHNFTSESPQYVWLENDLKSVNHTDKWIIFSGHRPLYSSTVFSNEFNVNENMRGVLEPLLLRYNVDLALWGHMHVYERTCPVRDGVCVGDYKSPGGTVHMVIGTAGAWAFVDKVNNSWSQTWKSVYGYIRLNIPDRSAMHIEFQQTSERWEVIDNVTLHFNGTGRSFSTSGNYGNTGASVEDTNVNSVKAVTDRTKLAIIIVPSVVGFLLIVGVIAFALWRTKWRKYTVAGVI